MLQTGIYPDFIVIDGKEGGTGAAPLEFLDHIGMPMREGLNFVHNARPQCADRHQRPRPHQARRQRQDRVGLRHRPRHGAGRRLVQRGARIHVRARLHSVPELPHRHLSGRRRDPGPDPPARAGGRRQMDPGQEFPRRHPARARAKSSRPRASIIPREFMPAHFSRRVSAREVVTYAELYPTLTARRTPRRRLRGPAFPRGLENGERRELPDRGVRWSFRGARLREPGIQWASRVAPQPGEAEAARSGRRPRRPRNDETPTSPPAAAR